MKKYIFIILVFIASSNLYSFADTYRSYTDTEGKIQYEITHEEKYYCPEGDVKPNEYNISGIYRPSEDCSNWNKDIFQTSGQNNLYNFCVEKQTEFQKKVDKGLCDKITVKRIEDGKGFCEFEVSEKYKKIFGTTCINSKSDTNDLREKFKNENGFE